MPGFHAILIVHDESRLIDQALTELLSWCDTVIVCDTGSHDNTWELITDAAVMDGRIIPRTFEPPVIHRDGLHAWLFHQYRDRFKPGDWIARVNIDQVYHIPPPEFIRSHVSPHEACINACIYNFVITNAELKNWQDGLETLADRARPVQDRRRYFRFAGPELSLFRYRRSMQWLPSRRGPFNAGLPAAALIPIRQYSAHDPVHLQTRCAIHAATAFLTPGAPESHWHASDWRRFLFHEKAPRTLYWHPDQPLPAPPASDFPQQTYARRFAQHAFYRSGLVNLIDRARPSFPESYRAIPITAEATERLARYLESIAEVPFFKDVPLPVQERRMQNVAPQPALESV